MQAIICASKHRFNVLGQCRQTQYTNHCNKRHNHCNNNSNNSNNNNNSNNSNNNNNNHSKNIDTNSASDICAGPFHSII